MQILKEKFIQYIMNNLLKVLILMGEGNNPYGSSRALTNSSIIQEREGHCCVLAEPVAREGFRF